MDENRHAYGDGIVREEREAVERRVRDALSEINEAIDLLERTCRQGRITRGELAEEKDMLRAQRYAFESRLD
ncbi:hypothetical protein BH23GEM9_BH23GEM9_28770 [soil metagenome]